MAYTKATLRRIEGTPGQALFTYRTADEILTIGGSGYFDDAVDDYNLSTGDMILAVTVTLLDGTLAFDGLVCTNTSGTVTTTLLS